MPRWTFLVGAMMLVLMLWTGGVAHAAKGFDCIPAAAEAPGHFDGDGDEVPSDRGEGVAHHHAGCSGHQLGTPGEGPAMVLGTSSDTAPFSWRESGVPGRGPDSLLRPPIA